ncbi:MAG: efflux RND transporter periplasmic adaptor subunit [Bacteroidales bacterium]|nr:efflux RND transporter periplasmic adaptor subunit [Bacteroidales bacterium]
MNKTIIISIITIIVFAVSCKNGGNDSEKIKKQIEAYESEIIEIRSKIADLQHQLDTMETKDVGGAILVGIETIKPQHFVNYIDVVGNVESDLQSLVSPESNGQIEKVYVREGDYVSSGQLMVSLKTDVTDKSINEVETSLDLAKTVYNKQKQLWDQKIGSEIQYLQAKNNYESMQNRLATLKAQLAMAQIKAPFDGYVETIFQKEGEIAAPGRQVIELVNLNSLKVTADVSESYVANIHVGDSAIVTFSSFPNLIIKAPISFVGSVINPNNRTFRIQIDIPNKEKLLKPNLITNIKLTESDFQNSIVIPSIIIKNDASGRKYIYVLSENESKYIATKRYISTGASYGNKTLVVSGLNSDEQIISQGYNLVKNGSQIRFK